MTVAAAVCGILLTAACAGDGGADRLRGPQGPPAAQQNTAPSAKQPLMDTPPSVATTPAPAQPPALPPPDGAPVSLVLPDPLVRDMQDLLRSFGEPGIQSTGTLDAATQVGIARFTRCLPEAERPDALGDVRRRMQGLNAVGWTFALCEGAFDSPPLVQVAEVPAEVAPFEATTPGSAPTLADTPGEAPPDPQLPPQVAVLPPPPPPTVELQVGQAAYAIESISCEGASGSWVLLYRGTVAAVDADSVDLDVDSRIGLRYWPGAEGFNDKEWFCVPRRRFCYAPVAFTDWKGKVKANDRISSSRDQVFDDALGPRGVQQFVQSRCGS